MLSELHYGISHIESNIRHRVYREFENPYIRDFRVKGSIDPQIIFLQFINISHRLTDFSVLSQSMYDPISTIFE